MKLSKYGLIIVVAFCFVSLADDNEAKPNCGSTVHGGVADPRCGNADSPPAEEFVAPPITSLRELCDPSRAGSGSKPISFTARLTEPLTFNAQPASDRPAPAGGETQLASANVGAPASGSGNSNLNAAPSSSEIDGALGYATKCKSCHSKSYSFSESLNAMQKGLMPPKDSSGKFQSGEVEAIQAYLQRQVTLGQTAGK